MYSPGLSRFISIDPEFQFGSGYVGIGNSPISGVDVDGGFFFGLFGSTSAQRQGARLFREQHGGKTVDWYKETIHNEGSDYIHSTRQELTWSRNWVLHDDGVFYLELMLVTAEVVIQNTYFNYDNGQPYAKDPMSKDAPRGLEFVGTDIYLDADRIYNDASLTGSADGALRGTWTPEDTRYAGYAVKYTGTALKYGGYIAAPFTGGTSMSVATAGGRMEVVGALLVSAGELQDEDVSGAMIEASGIATGAIIENGINKINPTPTERIILQGSTDITIEGSSKAIDSITNDNNK